MRQNDSKEENDFKRKGHIKDANAKIVFGNHELFAQFLRDFSNVDMFKDITADDITDVTDRYIPYLGIEFSSDVVKKIRINDIDNSSVYLIALLEHKSDIDYDVIFQLLRYMVCIWDDYAKEKGNNPKLREFKNPLVIPIVYYEGKDIWTATKCLSDRVFMGDVFSEYVPDFKYILVENNRYSNDELVMNDDEISLFMMFNKIQTADDLTRFLKTDKDKLNSILKKSSAQTIKIFMDIVWNLFMKLNVSTEEAQKYVEGIGGMDMGILFANMEKMDIQAERRNTAEQRERAERAEEEVKRLKKLLQSVSTEEKYVERIGGMDMGILFANMEKMDIRAERRNTAEQRERAERAEARVNEEKARADEEKARADAAEEEIKRLKKVFTYSDN